MSLSNLTYNPRCKMQLLMVQTFFIKYLNTDKVDLSNPNLLEFSK